MGFNAAAALGDGVHLPLVGAVELVDAGVEGQHLLQVGVPSGGPVFLPHL